MKSITVGTADLRAALQSVRVHAGVDPQLPDLARLRLAVGPVKAAVIATDRFTAGQAMVRVIEQTDTGRDEFLIELLPDDVAKILAIFKAGGKEEADAPQHLLRLDVTDKAVTVTDCSGLIDGRALKVPVLPISESAPLGLIPKLLARAHFADMVLLEGAVFNGDYLARFKVAGNQYGHSLVLEAHEGTNGVLVRCGPDYLGMLMPRSLSEDDVTALKRWNDEWTYWLPSPQPNDPVDLNEPDAPDDPADDPLLRSAAEYVIATQLATASLLQRKLNISFARAERFLEELEARGVVGPVDGKKGRAVLVASIEDLPTVWGQE